MKLMNFSNPQITRSPADAGGGAEAVEAEAVETTEVEAPEVEATSEATPEATDFSWAGEEFHKDGTFDADAFRGHYQDLLTERTLREEATAGVPEDGVYDFNLPEDFDLGEIELPEGVEFGLDLENEAFKPVLDELGAYFKEQSIPQAEATKLMGFMAKYKGAEAAQKISAADAEYKQLGANDAAREARLSRVGRALETKLPKDQAEAMKSMMGNLGAVRALETLIMGKNGASVTPVPPVARTVEDALADYYSKPS